jgi:alpha-ribazole phosphatase
VKLARLLLVRHGEPEMNSPARYWGNTDIALSEIGLRQAERLRDCLAKENIDRIYSSDLKRALVTAEIIASHHGLEIVACPELREIDFGCIEGLTFDQISKSYPEIVRLWMECSTRLRYPDGESIDELEERVGRFRKRLESHSREETVLVVAHNGILRTLVCQILDMDAEQRWQMQLDLASLSIIETQPGGGVMTRLNDISHLAKEE